MADRNNEHDDEDLVGALQNVAISVTWQGCVQVPKDFPVPLVKALLNMYVGCCCILTNLNVFRYPRTLVKRSALNAYQVRTIVSKYRTYAFSLCICVLNMVRPTLIDCSCSVTPGNLHDVSRAYQVPAPPGLWNCLLSNIIYILDFPPGSPGGSSEEYRECGV